MLFGQFRLNKGHNSKVLLEIWLVIKCGREIMPTNIMTKFDTRSLMMTLRITLTLILLQLTLRITLTMILLQLTLRITLNMILLQLTLRITLNLMFLQLTLRITLI